MVLLVWEEEEGRGRLREEEACVAAEIINYKVLYMVVYSKNKRWLSYYSFCSASGSRNGVSFLKMRNH